MTRFQVCLIATSIGWMALLALALAWLRAAAIAGEHVDQTMTDHYQDKDQER